MIYALHNFRRWLLVCVALVGAIGQLSGQDFEITGPLQFTVTNSTGASQEYRVLSHLSGSPEPTDIVWTGTLADGASHTVNISLPTLPEDECTPSIYPYILDVSLQRWTIDAFTSIYGHGFSLRSCEGEYFVPDSGEPFTEGSFADDGSDIPGGGGGTGMTLAEFQSTDTDTVATAQIALNMAAPTSSDMGEAGDAAAAAMSAAFAPVTGLVAPAEITGVAPDLSLTFPAAFGGATFDMNPFQGGIGSAASWFRSATMWAVFLSLGAWVWQKIGELTSAAVQAPQAKGNPVLGGTGAQATALASAALITASVVVLVAGVLSFALSSLDLASIKGALDDVNPLAGMAGGALWMLDQLFPVSAMITCGLFRVAFGMNSAALLAVHSAIVRFIVL